MRAETTVRTDALEAVIDYLEGLLLILRQLHEEEAGVREPNIFLSKLQEVEPEMLSDVWEPLRYQDGVGTGWSDVADNLEGLRHQLVERYGNAAL